MNSIKIFYIIHKKNPAALSMKDSDLEYMAKYPQKIFFLLELNGQIFFYPHQKGSSTKQGAHVKAQKAIKELVHLFNYPNSIKLTNQTKDLFQFLSLPMPRQVISSDELDRTQEDVIDITPFKKITSIQSN